MISSLVLCLAALTAASAQSFDQNTVSIPNDEFLERLRNWQIALSAPGAQQPETSVPVHRGSQKYGQPPPVGPISIPSPPQYQPHPPNYPQQGGYYPPPGGQQPGGYYPPPGQQPGGYYPPTPRPTLPTLPPILPPTLPPYLPPTKPPPTKPPATNSLSKFCLKPRGQFPSKTCNKYVNCWDDVVVEQECPSGLLFSEKGYCDYDYNVDCSRRPLPPPTSHPPTMPTDPHHHPKCPTLYGYYRDSKNCSIFYVCVGGQPVKFECPPTLVFNTEHGVCDYYYNVPSCPEPPRIGGPAVDPGPVYPVHPPIHPPHPPTYPPHPPTYPPHPPTYPPHPPTYPQHPPSYPPPYNPYTVKRVPAVVGINTRVKVFDIDEHPKMIIGVQRIGDDKITALVDEESQCTEGALYRLNPDCSQVSLCRNGKTEVINCGQDRAYDNVQDRCVPQNQARC